MIFLTGSGSRRTSVGTPGSGRRARVEAFSQQIDDLELVATVQVLVADPLQVGERADRPRRLSRDVEPQPVVTVAVRLLHDARVLPEPMSRATDAPSSAPAASSTCSPRSVRMNSRTWFECAMPRDLST